MGQRSILIGCLLVALMACSSENKIDYLLGEWYNESIRVDINALEGEADSVFSVPAGQWENMLQIQPIVTTYKSDGTYESVYTDLEGEFLQKSNGEWELEGDSLYLTLQGQTTGYYFEWREGKGLFEGYLDWDIDGNTDDFYSGIQIKR